MNAMHVDTRSSDAPIQGPPEFVRAVELQQAYWTYSADEQAHLEALGLEKLSWRERLRLHHLTCLQRLHARLEPSSATAKCRALGRLLMMPESPYRPRPALVWQRGAARPGGDGEQGLPGVVLNPSLTHLGCLEIYRLDAANHPAEIDFVSFDDLSGVMFAPPTVIRAAKLFYDHGYEEIVLVPMLYGLTWTLGSESDRAGSLTTFVAPIDDEELRGSGISGLGVGQQDLLIRSQGEENLLRLGSVSDMAFPLDLEDPRFDEKALARGLDPVELRRHMD